MASHKHAQSGLRLRYVVLTSYFISTQGPLSSISAIGAASFLFCSVCSVGVHPIWRGMLFQSLLRRCTSAASSPSSSSASSVQPPPRSAANYTPPKKKNPYLLKVASTYAKLPTGIRELVIVFPLTFSALVLVVLMDGWLPESMQSAMFGGAHKISDGNASSTRDMLTYHLEPVVDKDTGKVYAYRRVAVKCDSPQ